MINRLAYRLGLRLAQIKYIRSAIDDHADLNCKGARLIFKLTLGLLLIAGSNSICWPLIGVMSAMAVKTKHPTLALVGCPVIYAVTFICCGVGMAMAGGKGGRMFLRWRARVWTEWLLSHAQTHRSVSDRPEGRAFSADNTIEPAPPGRR